MYSPWWLSARKFGLAENLAERCAFFETLRFGGSERLHFQGSGPSGSPITPHSGEWFTGNNDGCIIFRPGGWNNAMITHNVTDDACECVGFHPASARVQLDDIKQYNFSCRSPRRITWNQRSSPYGQDLDLPEIT
jgi:hypothetical protein